jgi:hypothetical protein
MHSVTEHIPPCLASAYQASWVARSLYGLQDFIDKGFVRPDEVHEMINSAYKPSLKLISYTLNDQENEITIYSHAPIDMVEVMSLAQSFKISFKDASPVELAETIDKINEAFKIKVEANQLTQLYKDQVGKYESYCRRKGFSTEPDTACPMEYIAHNRDYTTLNRDADYNGYKICWVHGHDNSYPSTATVFSLDNLLAKLNNAYKGIYDVLFSQQKSSPTLRAEKIVAINSSPCGVLMNTVMAERNVDKEKGIKRKGSYSSQSPRKRRAAESDKENVSWSEAQSIFSRPIVIEKKLAAVNMSTVASKLR